MLQNYQNNIYRLRISRIQARVKKEKLDAIIIIKPQNVYYLSGFNPIIQSHPSSVILSSCGEAFLIVHSLRFVHAKKEAFLDEIRLFGKWGKYGKNAPQDFLTTVIKTLRELSLSDQLRIGLEFSYLPLSFFLKLKSLLHNAEFLDIDGIIREERMIKDEVEIGYIKDAAYIADVGMKAAIDFVRKRKTEIEVSVRAMITMKNVWKDKFSDREVVDFGTSEGGIFNALWAYCLSSSRMNLMCDSPSSRSIRKGDLVLVVIWTTINGYHAENERTIAVGSIGLEQKKAYNVIVRARSEAIKEIRSGIPISKIYNDAITIMKEDGYGNILPGRIGHGLGLGAHEAPSISSDNNRLLKEGMVLSFEPALRFGQLGGIQHSDTILINSNGFDYLTHTERGYLNV